MISVNESLLPANGLQLTKLLQSVLINLINLIDIKLYNLDHVNQD